MGRAAPGQVAVRVVRHLVDVHIAYLLQTCTSPKVPTKTPARFFAMAGTERKAVIKNADMSEDMQQDAVDCASQALEKYNIEKDIAAFIKKVCGRRACVCV
jgi:hypothetical protein